MVIFGLIELGVFQIHWNYESIGAMFRSFSRLALIANGS
jgi:hypothetical protein